MNESQKQWYEDTDFWECTRDFMFTPERWDEAAKSIDDLTALIQVEPPSAVLDLCCGPGRFALPLAEKGFRITAVDANRLFLDELRKRAEQSALNLEIVESDMRDYVQAEKFDAAINTFTSLGYFDDPAEDRRVIENLYTSLKPGGRLLLDTISREWILANFQKSDWQEIDGWFLLEEREFIDNTTRLRNRWVVVRDGKVKEFRFVLRMYSPAELMQLLRDVGFSSAQAMSGLKAEVFGVESTRLMILARK